MLRMSRWYLRSQRFSVRGLQVRTEPVSSVPWSLIYVPVAALENTPPRLRPGIAWTVFRGSTQGNPLQPLHAKVVPQARTPVGTRPTAVYALRDNTVVDGLRPVRTAVRLVGVLACWYHSARQPCTPVTCRDIFRRLLLHRFVRHARQELSRTRWGKRIVRIVLAEDIKARQANLNA